ncbi:PREDICTED: leptin receptor overlapping transcript-like 1 [Branchiostoma belcheri]|uniref:Leptin receptor overlapping transcript-like 1 n=1 Tax=Branchiostoma belcheri TaxID=7741 RepID=A0A6P4YT76_BRABE|nr:PREDICTED: leptin receptor overlapping transcript-like 1 [Branchiostoma belcheri]
MNGHMIQDGGHQSLIGLAFFGAIGMTFVVLACALPQFNLWWPFFVVMFYILAPIPWCISRRYTEEMSDSASSACTELSIFLTTGIVVSAFGLPIVLARAGVIQGAACGLTVAGNVVVFITILAYFIVFTREDDFAFSGF